MAFLAARALAQTSTVSLINPYGDSGSYEASVIGVNPTATTYEVTCAPVTTDFCGPASTITQGPSMWEMAYTDPGEVSISAHCDLKGSSSATCTESVGGSLANSQGVETSVLSADDFSSIWQPVVITAGLEKLGAASTAAATTASQTPASGAKASSGASVASTASITIVTGTTTGSTTGSAAARASSTGAAAVNLVRKGSIAGLAGVLLAALAL